MFYFMHPNRIESRKPGSPWGDTQNDTAVDYTITYLEDYCLLRCTIRITPFFNHFKLFVTTLTITINYAYNIKKDISL